MNFTLNRQTLLALILTLSLGSLLTLSYVLWQWRQDWLLAHQKTLTTLSVPSENKIAAMIDAITSKHLFGQSLNGSVPLTSLQLRVTGIIKSENHDGPSKVLISFADHPSKIFHLGDQLPYGVKVYDITSDAVILQNEGRLEKLPLLREKLIFKPRNREDEN